MELETESFGEKATWLDPSEKAFDAREPDPHQSFEPIQSQWEKLGEIICLHEVSPWRQYRPYSQTLIQGAVWHHIKGHSAHCTPKKRLTVNGVKNNPGDVRVKAARVSWPSLKTTQCQHKSGDPNWACGRRAVYIAARLHLIKNTMELHYGRCRTTIQNILVFVDSTFTIICVVSQLNRLIWNKWSAPFSQRSVTCCG